MFKITPNIENTSTVKSVVVKWFFVKTDEEHWNAVNVERKWRVNKKFLTLGFTNVNN
jgi:hypothetical protein